MMNECRRGQARVAKDVTVHSEEGWGTFEGRCRVAVLLAVRRTCRRSRWVPPDPSGSILFVSGTG